MKKEFRELLRASGWSQAEAARQLAMTPSALSQIVRKNSPVRPSLVTLRLFGLLLCRNKTGAARRLTRGQREIRAKRWEQDLIRRLRRISPKTRKPILSVVYAMIEAARSKGAGGKTPRRPGGERGSISKLGPGALVYEDKNVLGNRPGKHGKG